MVKESKILLIAAITTLTVLVSGCGGRVEGDKMTLEELLTVSVETDSHETETAESVVKTEVAAQENSQGEEPENGGQTLWIHICGEVAVPGIYEFPKGCRLYDALVAAGGFTKDADTTHYNLVDFLVDGMQIEVPRKADTKEDGTAGGGAYESFVDYGVNGKGQTVDDGLVNINTASMEELQRLPGIGESRAMAIVEYRQKCGGFTEISQIMEVSGIKEAIFAKIKDLIKVR